MAGSGQKILVNQLRHKITIEENQGTINDGGGNKIPVWVPIASDVWANVRPIDGSEITTAERLEQQLTHMVTIRYRKDIEKKHRIVYRGRILKIENIINKDELNVQLILQCKE